MTKSKIYTRTGDEGNTGLVSGARVPKSDERIDLYGELDELNSRIGFSLSFFSLDRKKEIEFLHVVQSAIFDLGSNLACEYENRSKYKLPQLTEGLIQQVESEIDRMDQDLEPLKNFILPGGTSAAASVHLLRTCARNVERKLVRYQHISQEELPDLSLIFLNRLSDYFFVLARYLNKKENCAEIAWKPRT